MDAIFYPCMSYNLDEHLGDNHYNCPVVAYYPEVFEGNCPELKATKFIYDYFNLERRKDFYKKFQQALDHYFRGWTERPCMKPLMRPTTSTPAICSSCATRAPRSLRRPAGRPPHHRAGGPPLPR